MSAPGADPCSCCVWLGLSCWNGGRAGRRRRPCSWTRCPASEIEELLVDRAGTVSPETLDRIVVTAQGNPLFAEQLLAALDYAPVDAIPASLQGLLTMRLDRLGPGARDMLRCAAVVGAEFSQDALVALLPDQAHRFVDRHLDELERRQLLAQVSQGPSGSCTR